MPFFKTAGKRQTFGLVCGTAVAVALFSIVGWQWRKASAKATFSRDRVPRLGHAGVLVAPGLYLIGTMSPSAVYVIETSEGLILVDSGLDSDAGLLKAEMAKLGLDWKRIRAILLSHVHGDHTGGAQALRSATEATVYAGSGDAQVLADGGPREAFFSTFYMPDQALHSTTVDVALEGGETISLGGVRIEAIGCPGHTPGTMCYLMERDGYRALFAGDVIMMLHGDDQPRTELDKPLGTYSAYLAPHYRGDARAYLESLRRLRTWPVPDLVLPGHPAADRTPQSPCLSEERWKALLKQGIDDLEKVLARYQADGADFLDGNPKELLKDLYYLGEFRGSAIYGFFAASKFFVVNAPGPGLVDFLKTRLEQVGRELTAPAAVLLTSGEPAAAAGVREIIGKGGEVVASREGLSKLKESLPPETKLIAAEDLPREGWFPVVSIPLRGRGFAPVAYELEWAGKKVLLTGRIPQSITQETGQALISELTGPSADVVGYSASIFELRERKPDLWLPARATHEQNANLYDRDWANIIEDNVMLINFARNFILSPGKKE
jgi:glyoxylase-like metal-dependent hydrolase (beta-lactamase superfamily II)